MYSELGIFEFDKGKVGINISDECKTLDFAADELERYINNVCGKGFSEVAKDPGDYSIVINLILDKTAVDKEPDRFSIGAGDGSILIKGNNGRSVLFGVYMFLKEYFCIDWLSPVYESIPQQVEKKINIQNKDYEGDFKERGFVAGVAESKEYIANLIDWMAKNFCNNVFVDFKLWKKFRKTISSEVSKRGLLLTVGGHGINMFLPVEKYYKENPGWFALNNGERISKQPCFSNEAMLDTLIGNIIQYCHNGREINRISIWPNDNSYTCECNKCKEKGFIQTYVDFLGKLKNELIKKGFDTAVQYIAYNAQLEWKMLEQQPEQSEVDTLIACWGRNYKESLGSPSGEYDKRFKESITRWALACNEKFNSKLSVFEYYSDYWMLSSLYPPLLKIISKDMDYYRSIGVYEMTSLIFNYNKNVSIIRNELLKEVLPEDHEKYEFNSEHPMLWTNLYFLASKAWDTRTSYEDMLYRFCSAFYGQYKDVAIKIIETLEENLARLSEYTTKMFCLRFTDVWARDSWLSKKSLSSEVKKWTPENDDINIPNERIYVCEEILSALKGLEEYLEPLEVRRDNSITSHKGQSGNYITLLEYLRFVINKLKSINYQSKAQKHIINAEYSSAQVNLLLAIEMEESINGWDRKDCEKWLNYALERV